MGLRRFMDLGRRSRMTSLRILLIVKGVPIDRSGDTAPVGLGTQYGLYFFCRSVDTASARSGTHHGPAFCRSGDTAPARSGTHHGLVFCRSGDTASAGVGTHHGLVFVAPGTQHRRGLGHTMVWLFVAPGTQHRPLWGRMTDGSV
jgi:hypothetical protein